MGSNDHKNDNKQERLRNEVGGLLDGFLAADISSLGGELTGVTLLDRGYDSLMILKASFEGKKMVCFVGAGTWAQCLRKASAEARQNKLKWREDKYQTNSG